MLFEVLNYEEGDRWEEIEAHDYGDAAQLYAERYDAGDFTLFRGSKLRLAVRSKGHNGILHYEVEGRLDPTYRASIIHKPAQFEYLLKKALGQDKDDEPGFTTTVKKTRVGPKHS